MNRRRAILVVDDDDDVRDTVAAALEEEGYSVLTASTGREALGLLLGGARPLLILLDLMMPDMDGFAFRAEQRQSPEIASIPVIAFTAHAAPRETVERLGAAAFLRKPLRLQDLLATVERVHSS